MIYKNKERNQNTLKTDQAESSQLVRNTENISSLGNTSTQESFQT